MEIPKDWRARFFRSISEKHGAEKALVGLRSVREDAVRRKTATPNGLRDIDAEIARLELLVSLGTPSDPA